jgi:hypothetical protein
MSRRVATGEMLTQAQAIGRGGVQFRELHDGFRNERDLFHVGTANGARGEMLVHRDVGQHRKSIVQVLGGSKHDISASQLTLKPM